MNIKIDEAVRRVELLSMVIACLLAGAAHSEAVGACRELLEGGGLNRSCERAIPKPVVVVPPKLVLTPPKLVAAPPKPVLPPPKLVLTPPKPVLPPPKLVVTPPKPVLPPPKLEVAPPEPVLTPPKPVAPPQLVFVPIVPTSKPLTLAKAPELEAGGMVGALTFVCGAILVMRGRKRRLDL